jgi:hypothetical protein
MGEIPHGQPPAGPLGFSAYYFSRMKNLKTSRAGEPASAEAQRGTNPARNITVSFWGDDNMGIRESNAEVRIRHETNFLLKSTNMNRIQNQAGNAPSECQL